MQSVSQCCDDSRMIIFLLQKISRLKCADWVESLTGLRQTVIRAVIRWTPGLRDLEMGEDGEERPADFDQIVETTGLDPEQVGPSS